MITLDFSLALSVYFFSILLLVSAGGVFYNLTRKEENTKLSTIVEICPYCTFIFLNYRKTEISICPRCKSYVNLKEDIRATKSKNTHE